MAASNGARIVHRSPGRLRVRVGDLRENPDRASRIVGRLSDVPGVQRVETFPETGSVLVLHEGNGFDVERFIGIARDEGLFDVPPDVPVSAEPALRPARGVTVYGGWDRANDWFAQGTRGLLDLRTLIPLAMVIWAIRQLVIERPPVRTPWYTLLWYAFGLFTKWNPEPK
jgi:hypothetical protein